MTRTKQSSNELKIARKIKDGQGQGTRKNHKPWLYIHYAPSSGRSHRVYNYKIERMHPFII